MKHLGVGILGYDENGTVHSLLGHTDHTSQFIPEIKLVLLHVLRPGQS